MLKMNIDHNEKVGKIRHCMEYIYVKNPLLMPYPILELNEKLYLET